MNELENAYAWSDYYMSQGIGGAAFGVRPRSTPKPIIAGAGKGVKDIVIPGQGKGVTGAGGGIQSATAAAFQEAAREGTEAGTSAATSGTGETWVQSHKKGLIIGGVALGLVIVGFAAFGHKRHKMPIA